MSEVFSILLHNRQRYEQGKEGLWFSLPTTTEKLQEALREIGISADNPQDFFLYDYRSPQERPIKFPRDLVLSADVDELNFLAARLEKLDAAELAELNAALTSPQSDFRSIGQIIDYPDNVDYYVHLPDVTGTGQLGDYYLNRSGMVDMPEEWKAGIFLPRFGLHIANTEHGVFTDYGYLVKSGDEWQRVHEGQPVPEEYRVMAYPAPEILRDEAPARTVQPEAAPTAEAAAPPPVVPIILNSQNSADRMKEITDRLETGIQELFESERYKAYLTSMAKFHSYSFNNTLLIAMQGGQLVAGYLPLGAGTVNQYLLFVLVDLIFFICALIYLASNFIVVWKEKSPEHRYKGENLFFFGQVISKLNTTSKAMTLISVTLVLAICLFIAAPILTGWASGYLDIRSMYDVQISSRYNDVYDEEYLPGDDYEVVTDYC